MASGLGQERRDSLSFFVCRVGSGGQKAKLGEVGVGSGMASRRRLFEGYRAWHAKGVTRGWPPGAVLTNTGRETAGLDP